MEKNELINYFKNNYMIRLQKDPLWKYALIIYNEAHPTRQIGSLCCSAFAKIDLWIKSQ